MTASLLKPICPRATDKNTSAIPPRPRLAKSWYLPNAVVGVPSICASTPDLGSLAAPIIRLMEYLPYAGRSRSAHCAMHRRPPPSAPGLAADHFGGEGSVCVPSAASTDHWKSSMRAVESRMPSPWSQIAHVRVISLPRTVSTGAVVVSQPVAA
jgi:hypothetical protein